MRVRARKLEPHCHHSFDLGRTKASKGKSTLAHVHDLSSEGLTRLAQQLNGQVNLVAEISAVLAFHPGKRYVENTSQLLLLNRLIEHEISSRFNRHAHRGRSIYHRDDDRQLVRPTGAYLGEQIGGVFHTVAVNDEAIEVPPSREFDSACSICAHFEFDTRCAETSPDNLQQRHVAGQ